MNAPTCILCGLILKDNDGKNEKGEVVELQTSYYMHNPRNIHEDVLVTAHTECFNAVGKSHKDFDKPTQKDYADVKYPTIKDGVITLKKKDDFIKEIK